MHYLIATHNKDKAEITKRLISILHPDVEVDSLASVGIAGEVAETGSITERATAKAIYFAKEAKRVGLSYDFVIGIDDGFALPEYDIDTAESYEVTDAILGDKYPIGTIVINRRAYARVDSAGSVNTVITETPFYYLGNIDNVVRQEGVYPLSQVLAPEGDTVSVAEKSDEEIFSFYLEYAKEPLSSLLDH